MHCTIMFLAHVWLVFLICHVYAELELEVPTEQVQVEDFTNLVLTQGKPRCINQCSLTFILNIYLYVSLDCALLSQYELDDNLVALGATFRIILVDPISVEHH
jgi:hypothetical protein